MDIRGAIFMDIIDALNSRFTARAFKPDPVDRNTLENVIEAALRALPGPIHSRGKSTWPAARS